MNATPTKEKAGHRWNLEHMPDLAGRVAIVTGGNSGLGFETVQALAQKNAQVILTSRSEEKGATARDEILKTVPDARIEIMQLDLANLQSVRDFAANFKAKYARLDLLINNAGVMALPYQKTADGFEMQFGTNHLGHFALTGLLLDTILNTAGSRIVNLASNAHKWGQVNFDDLMRAKKYKKWEAYGQSKVSNLLFTYELARKLDAAGKRETLAVAAHPGYSATNLQSAGPRMEGSSFGEALMSVGNSLLAQSAAMGTLPTLFAATEADVKSGDYIGPDGFQEFWGHPKKVSSNDHSRDEAVAARLWDVSEELTGVRFNFA